MQKNIPAFNVVSSNKIFKHIYLVLIGIQHVFYPTDPYVKKILIYNFFHNLDDGEMWFHKRNPILTCKNFEYF